MLPLADSVQSLTLKYSLSSLILVRKATEYIPSVEVQLFFLYNITTDVVTTGRRRRMRSAPWLPGLPGQLVKGRSSQSIPVFVHNRPHNSIVGGPATC